jgi:hypothetical protein
MRRISHFVFCGWGRALCKNINVSIKKVPSMKMGIFDMRPSVMRVFTTPSSTDICVNLINFYFFNINNYNLFIIF